VLALHGHAFHAADASAPVVFGSGAFNERAFGYGVRPTGGRQEIGHEIDLTLTWKPLPRVELLLGWSRFFGGAVYRALFDDEDAGVFYAQVALRR